MMTDTILKYHANNSGGYWWLSNQDWDNLAEVGWNVFWMQEDGVPLAAYSDDPKELLAPVPKAGHIWLSASAQGCAKKVASVREGIQEWEDITGQDAAAIGCTCCGRPHSFEYIKDGETDYVYMTAPMSSIEYPD